MTKYRIALITTWFPPAQSVAVNRMSAFAKYLSDEFELEVFTLGDENKEQSESFGKVHYIESKSILNHFKHQGGEQKIIHHFKTAINLLARKLNINGLNSWKRNTLNALNISHQNNSFDLIISSYAPAEAHDVALAFKKKQAGIPWIADMRDGMSKNPHLNHQDQKKLARKEQSYAPYIDALSSVSEPVLDEFRNIYPQINCFEEVRNGFDHDVKPIKNFNEVFTMVFAGTFYSIIKPDIFLKVLARLKKEESQTFNFKIQLVGSHRNFHIPPALVSSIEFIPKVPYLEAINYMRNADCNLMILPPLKSRGQFSGKLFDYLSVEKPILAMIDKTEVSAKLIQDHHAGFIADFYNENEIEIAFRKAYDLWKNKELLPIDSSLTQQLHRKHQVKKLANLIHKLLDS